MSVMSVFNVHIQSIVAHACHGHRCRFLCPIHEKKGGRGGDEGVDWRAQAVRPGSVAGVKVLWNLELPVGLSQKRNMCAFQ